MVSPPTTSAARMLRAPRALWDRRAFTLFELIVVLSIMTILASIVAPKYASAVARYRLDSAVRRVVTDIEQAKALARATGTTQVIAFSPSTHSYSIIGYLVGTTRGNHYTVRLNQPPYSVTLQSANFGGMTDLKFGGFALPADGGNVVVRGGTETRTVLIDNTGAVTIQ